MGVYWGAHYFYPALFYPLCFLSAAWAWALCRLSLCHLSRHVTCHWKRLTKLSTHINPHPKAATKIYICSGGRDSMALLFACQQLQPPIHVIHINHKLQKSQWWLATTGRRLLPSTASTMTAFVSIGNRSKFMPPIAESAVEQQVNEQQVSKTTISNPNQWTMPELLAIVPSYRLQAKMPLLPWRITPTIRWRPCWWTWRHGTGLAGLTGMTAFAVQMNLANPFGYGVRCLG